MKKILFSLLFFGLFTTTALSIETNKAGIGVNIVKDPYNKKTIVYSTLKNSPAEIIPISSEITAINGQKTKSLSFEEIVNLLQGEENTQITLLTKDPKNKKQTYVLTRKKLNIPTPKIDKRFETHWQQVLPDEYAYETINPSIIQNKLSSSYMKNKGYKLIYWQKRKTAFTKGYNACLTYPKTEQNSCLMNLVNREISRTNEDKNIEVQQEILRQQKQINYQLYDIDSRLRYQNIPIYNHLR